MDDWTFSVFVLTGLVEVALPLLVAYWVISRYKVRVRVIAYAAAFYVAAQVAVFAPVYAGREFINTPLAPLLVAVASGLIEETLRYLTLKHVLRDVRDWVKAVGFGAGWGGIQAVLLGWGLIMTAFYIQYINSLDEAAFSELNATEGFVDQVDALKRETQRVNALDALSNLVAVTSIFTVQLALSAAVTTAVAEDRGGLFAMALAGHSILNVLVTYLNQQPEVYSVSVLVAGGAVGFFVLRRLRGSSR